MPSQHNDGNKENSCIEKFLADARQSIGDLVCEDRQERGASDARPDAGGDPSAAARNTLCHCKHDTDDNAGFDHFPEYNNQCAKHESLLTARSGNLRSCLRGNRQRTGTALLRADELAL